MRRFYILVCDDVHLLPAVFPIPSHILEKDNRRVLTISFAAVVFIGVEFIRMQPFVVRRSFHK